MIDIQEKKNSIISFLDSNGPSLPVRVAKTIEMEPVFASAILSELLNEKRVKLSHMKIGASPLYILPNQEQKLENLSEHLKNIEKEAYQKIKENKFLIDENETPAIRVALRSLKDFATPFKFKEKIIWRYSFISEEEIRKLIDLKEKGIQKIPSLPKLKTKQITKKKSELPEKKVENIFEESNKESAPEFVEEIKSYLSEKNIEFVEEIQIDKKEIVARVNLKSKIGDINFLLIAKNKKTTSKDEIKSALQRASYHKMPCLYLLRKEPQKSLLKFIEDYKNLIKIKVIENP